MNRYILKLHQHDSVVKSDSICIKPTKKSIKEWEKMQLDIGTYYS